MRPALFALAVFAFALPAAAGEPLLLAPGKSVTIVDAADPSMRVVLAAPANEPLDLAALFAGADPREGIQSLATRSQVRPAGAIVRNADGSFSLSAPVRAAASSAKTIEGGAIVFGDGRYAWQAEVPSAAPAAPAVAEQMMHEIRDRSPKPPLTILNTPLPPPPPFQLPPPPKGR